MNWQLTKGLFLKFARRFGTVVVVVSCAVAAVMMLCSVSVQANGGNSELDTATETAIAISLLADAPYVDITSNVVYTITVQNPGDTPSGSFLVTDVLPLYLSYIPESGSATVGEFSQADNQIEWRGNLAPGATAQIRFAATLPDDMINNYTLSCRTRFINQAIVIYGNQRTRSNQSVVDLVCPDFGDAPDSTNSRLGIAMSAYPGVQANFPTDYLTGSIARTPWGPLHRNPKLDAWLGERVTGETHVDQHAGSVVNDDAAANLVILADIADGDGGDDGVTFPVFHHCQPTTIDVIVNVAEQTRVRYLNAWLDWNRDGDWADMLDCPGTAAPEWAVQNYTTTLGAGRHTVSLPVMMVYNPDPTLGLWARVTLAEEPAERPDDAAAADGRGPFGGYAYGETEDYGIGIEQAALAETSLSLRYTTAVTEITLGGIIPYTLTITNAGTQPITDAALSVALPNCLTLVPDSLHSTLTGIVHDSSLSQLQWRGALTAARSETVTWQMTTPVDLVYCEQLLSYAQLTHDALSEPLLEVIEVNYRLPTIFAPIVTKRASVTTVVPGGEIEFAVTVENVGETPILGSVLLRDFMPPDGRYVPGSLITDADVLTATYAASLPPQIIWQSPLPPLSKREFRYRVRLLERVQCGAALYNLLTAESVIDLQASVLEAPITVVCPEPVQFTDFGDAPDSDSNHHGLNNTAYIDDGTLGHFPTVWEGTPAGEPSGPTHGTAHFWLGSMVDAEPYADLNLYEESNQIPPPPASNILDNGLTDIADSDLDDGWWNQGVPMLHCEPTMLIIALSRAALPANIDTLWLNVWFDGNRDGDWQDVGDCPGTNKETGETAYEWIVQDYEIDPATLSVEEPLVLYVPTMRVLNQQPDRKAWLRMTLSEQKAIVPVNGSLPDGRGPVYPNYFAVGETEDWLMAEIVVDNTQPFTTELEISGATPAMATLGTEITYLHFLTLDNDATPAIAELTHRLPTEVTLTNPPTITPNTIDDMYNEHLATLNAFTPFPATFDSTQGARGTIHWRGQMPGASYVFIEYTVRIDSCPPPDQTGQPQLHSVVTIRQADGTDQDLAAIVPVDCVQNERPAQQLYLPIVSR